ncbi:type VI secretion system membrane subunit TssM [Sphingomonas sp. NFR15]|uniref:type VI secretion system membrane subunit TssM n=1 Tax=Sphingomonas sp. NFR15 TaxID=1566282 RepID=UPI00088EA3AA|nr:type VI secretion system membrane subunit TssM [Sphingomonas sp. NFR15]SDA24712.1 type VI secretion system protein ImpL [Sphingomonas sp. NFR15]
MDRLTRNWWAVAGTAASILVLIFAVGLPTLFPVLRAPWVRALLVGMVLIGFAGAAGWRLWRARRASQAIAGELTRDDGTLDPSESEARALTARMRDAMTRLKTAAAGQRDYLYSRPWYAIIGPSGTGKTTALRNSGLRFPWSEAALGGAGVTRDLDFWFADAAVLIDTAGRYTTQNAGDAADVAGWEQFLKLLRRHRPRQPINGIIVALSIETLMTSDLAKIDAHAAAIRRRLAELRRMLGISVPIYFLLTKADLLSGFTEFFADLDAQGRRAVLGDTLDLDAPVDQAAILAAFDRVTAAMWARLPRRLHDEADVRRRSLLLGFPAQLAELRGRVARLAEGAFIAEPVRPHILRGVYLASGVQQGVALDRVLSAMAEVYDEPQAPPSDRSARAFFLNRLLTDVIFPEAGLVRSDPAARRRARRASAAGYSGVGIVGLVAVAALTGSFAANHDFQGRLLTSAQQASAQAQSSGIDLQEVRASDPDLEQALPLLDRLRALPRGFDAGTGAPPLRMRFGLYQAGLADSARESYQQALQRVMLPRILLRLEQVLRSNVQNPQQLYEPLKTYLMLGGYGPLDRQGVRAWVVQDWRDVSLAGPDREDVRARLGRHLDALLADPDIGQVWAGGRAPLDGALIASARAAVQTLSLSDRAYAVLRERAAASSRPDWRAGDLLATGDAQAFEGGDALLGATIPWFFTREGYLRGYQQGMARVQAELDSDLWVLGPDAAKQSIRAQVPEVRAAVAEDYARDYIAAWDGMLAMVRPADYFTNRAALGAFTRDPSPLKVLLQEVRRNTALAGGGAANVGDAGGMIRDHFRQLGDFAGAGGTSAPVDELVKAVRQAAAASAAAGTAGAALTGGAVQGQLATALGELSTAGVVAPPQLQTFVGGAARTGRGAAVHTARLTVDAQYAGVLADCLKTTRGHYPFDRSAAADLAAADLQRLFGAGGEIDVMVRDHLQPLLDTGHSPWRWRSGDPLAGGLSPDSAAQFERAGVIRDLASGGVSLGVASAGMTGGITAVEFSTGGATHRFEIGAHEQAPAIWTPTSLPAAHVALFAGNREVKRIEMLGPWALFRLLDAARVRNAGPSRLRATFGEGAQTASLDINLPSTTDPFGRGGPFSFRCPARL